MMAAPLVSQLCTEATLRRPDFQGWAEAIKEEPGLMHRKIWEWCFICRALEERDMLRPGRLGLGFAVGHEAMTSVFAARGARIVATDAPPATAAAAGWVDTRQHAQDLAVLNKRGLCDDDVLRRNVEFRYVDMTAIPREFDGRFDFTWSACAFEHLGSLEKGMQFVLESLRCLKPGGVAVHTTEFNLGSNEDTVSEGETVLYRRRDIEALVARLRREGHEIEVDFREGQGHADGYIDLPPYTHRPHLRLALGQYVITSIALVIRKRPRRWWWPFG